MKINILYCEDEPLLREAFLLSLQQSLPEASITECSDGQEAIKQLDSNKEFDLIISDYEMPFVSGLKLFEHMTRNSYKIPFILCSGNSEIKVEPYLLIDGFYFIPKPFLIEDLLKVMGIAFSEPNGFNLKAI